MHISLIRNLITASWMISPQAISAFSPVFRGLMLGMEMEKESPSDIRFVSVKSRRTDIQEGSIAISTLSGLMLKHDQECGPLGTRTIARKMQDADSNPDVIGHILIVESGGGASNSVPEIADTIKSLTKPIVGFIDGCACSAALYAVSYCPYIISSNDMDMVGCVGTMIEFEDFPKFNKKEDGQIHVRIYADQSNEKNLDYENALGGDYSLIKKNLLNPITELFISDVKKNRPNIKDEQLHGATYFAKDVVGGFIDEIGSFEKAVDYIISLSLKNGKKTQQLNINKSMAFEHLNQIPSCADLQIEEGNASLNEEQLNDIEAALVSAGQIENLNQQIADLNATIATHEAIIAARESRISELETAIESGKEPAVPSASADPDPSNSSPSGIDPVEYCKNHLKNRY